MTKYTYTTKVYAFVTLFLYAVLITLLFSLDKYDNYYNNKENQQYLAECSKELKNYEFIMLWEVMHIEHGKGE